MPERGSCCERLVNLVPLFYNTLLIGTSKDVSSSGVVSAAIAETFELATAIAFPISSIQEGQNLVPAIPVPKPQFPSWFPAPKKAPANLTDTQNLVGLSLLCQFDESETALAAARDECELLEEFSDEGSVNRGGFGDTDGYGANTGDKNYSNARLVPDSNDFIQVIYCNHEMMQTIKKVDEAGKTSENLLNYGPSSFVN